MKKEDFFSKLENKCPNDDELQRIIDIIKRFNIKNGEKLSKLYLNSDVILLADVFRKFIKISVEECGIILYFV